MKPMNYISAILIAAVAVMGYDLMRQHHQLDVVSQEQQSIWYDLTGRDLTKEQLEQFHENPNLFASHLEDRLSHDINSGFSVPESAIEYVMRYRENNTPSI